VTASGRHLFHEDFNLIVEARGTAVHGNPLFLVSWSSTPRKADELVSPLAGEGEEECRPFVSIGIPYIDPSNRRTEAFLNYINGRGEISEKNIFLDERIICGITIYNIAD
jgi:hypothetical protein